MDESFQSECSVRWGDDQGRSPASRQWTLSDTKLTDRQNGGRVFSQKFLQFAGLKKSRSGYKTCPVGKSSWTGAESDCALLVVRAAQWMPRSAFDVEARTSPNRLLLLANALNRAGLVLRVQSHSFACSSHPAKSRAQCSPPYTSI